MQVTTVGPYLAKNIFQMHGILRVVKAHSIADYGARRCWRFFSTPILVWSGLKPAVQAITRRESRTSSTMRSRLIPPMYVQPYVKRGKPGAIDA